MTKLTMAELTRRHPKWLQRDQLEEVVRHLNGRTHTIKELAYIYGCSHNSIRRAVDRLARLQHEEWELKQKQGATPAEDKDWPRHVFEEEVRLGLTAVASKTGTDPEYWSWVRAKREYCKPDAQPEPEECKEFPRSLHKAELSLKVTDIPRYWDWVEHKKLTRPAPVDPLAGVSPDTRKRIAMAVWKERLRIDEAATATGLTSAQVLLVLAELGKACREKTCDDVALVEAWMHYVVDNGGDTGAKPEVKAFTYEEALEMASDFFKGAMLPQLADKFKANGGSVSMQLLDVIRGCMIGHSAVPPMLRDLFLSKIAGVQMQTTGTVYGRNVTIRNKVRTGVVATVYTEQSRSGAEPTPQEWLLAAVRKLCKSAGMIEVNDALVHNWVLLKVE